MILGILGLTKLPLQRFPDIAPPAVLVTAVYPGANAETILRSVAPSLEESINGVENMSYMSSTASNDGTLAITVYFKLGTNPDQAAVNVQNRVARHQPVTCRSCATGYNHYQTAKQFDWCDWYYTPKIRKNTIRHLWPTMRRSISSPKLNVSRCRFGSYIWWC